jgi:adenylate cyclase
MSKRSNRRSLSIRWSLFKNLLLLVVLISGSLLIYSVAGAIRAVHPILASLFEEVSETVAYELGEYFSPVSTSIQVARDLGLRDVFSPDDIEAANDVFIPVLSAIPQMASVITGDDAGNSLMLIRRPNEWFNVIIRGGSPVAEWRQLDKMGRVLKTWRGEIDFDPRTRPWYTQVEGKSDEAIRWTAPYAFVPSGDSGITAAVRVNAPRRSYVLAFDILLEDLSKFAQKIWVPGDGMVFVLTADGRFLVPPSDPAKELGDLLLKRPEEASVPIVAESVRRWRERNDGRPFQFKHEGESWWCGFRRYDLGPDQAFWIGVVVPERNLVGETQNYRIALLLVTMLALGVATLMALYLSKSYSEPLQELVEHSARLQTLKTDVAVEVKSRLTEVRHLAEAQENMRRALDSFARYVPVEVVRELLDRGEAAEIGGRNAEVTILFTDIEGFTTIAESMTAAELTSHMSSYLEMIVNILHRHNGTVDKFVGDSVMAFWGAPKPLENHCQPAVAAVVEICEWLERANREWREQGLPALPTRFGLSSGKVTVGNVGAVHRLSYTVLGDAVNLAQRLEALNSELNTTVLADETVRKTSGEGFAWRDVGEVEIKGKMTFVRVFELLGRKSSRL